MNAPIFEKSEARAIKARTAHVAIPRGRYIGRRISTFVPFESFYVGYRMFHGERIYLLISDREMAFGDKGSIEVFDGGFVYEMTAEQYSNFYFYSVS